MIYLMIGVCICAADLWCKGKIDYADPKVARILHRLPRQLAGGRFRIDCVHNHGLAFHLFEKHPVLPKLLSAAMFAGIAFLGIPLCFLDGVRQLACLGIGLLLGGGASNLIDRVKKGYVVDYMNLNFPLVKKIYFNLGDVGILAGCIFILISQLLPKKK